MATIPIRVSTIVGKIIRQVAKLRGGGSALPGLVVESLSPDFTKTILAQLRLGVVVISGTNGKTTTTKMVVELLEGQGLRVFTNRTGSNFTRGVAAALLGDVDLQGRLHADIAVLELDEAHAVHFVRLVQPRYSLLLNVMRDQLDRFGETDTTAKMLQELAKATTEAVIVNREDPHLVKLARSLSSQQVVYFGLDKSMQHLFPSDDNLRGAAPHSEVDLPLVSQLMSIEGKSATILLNDQPHSISLQLEGIYNIYNAVAAAATIQTVLGAKLQTAKLLGTLQSITPAFGRGEKLLIGDRPLELVLVKNPGGFRLSLQSFPPEGVATMIAINDNYADGRDMSWLWDVDFESLQAEGVACVSGVRAYDMALRLQYDEVEMTYVEPTLRTALAHFIQSTNQAPMRIFCTYTAMLTLRRELSRYTTVEVVS